MAFAANHLSHSPAVIPIAVNGTVTITAAGTSRELLRWRAANPGHNRKGESGVVKVHSGELHDCVAETKRVESGSADGQPHPAHGDEDQTSIDADTRRREATAGTADGQYLPPRPWW